MSASSHRKLGPAPLARPAREPHERSERSERDAREARPLEGRRAAAVPAYVMALKLALVLAPLGLAAAGGCATTRYAGAAPPVRPEPSASAATESASASASVSASAVPTLEPSAVPPTAAGGLRPTMPGED